MKEAMINFFNSEYKDAERLFETRPFWFNPKETIYNAMQRCLGVAQFVQTTPNKIPYEVVEVYYNEVKEKLEKLLEKN